MEESLRRPAQDAALQSVTADAVTLRAAMNWANSRGDQLAALRIASAVPIGLVGERRQIITSLLERLGSGVEPWFAGHAYSALGNLAFEQGDWAASSESHAASAEQFRLAGSARNAAWATYFGVHPAWGAGDLTKADALVRQAIDGFRSDGDAMGLGNALGDAALLDDGSRRGPAAGRRSRRAPASDRRADRHRPHRRRTRDHRLRPG